MDPLSGTPWSAPQTVDSFVRAAPNDALMDLATRLRDAGQRGWAVDIGCGAGRNAVPLAQAGWTVLGLDLSRPMLDAAAARAADAGADAVRFALAPMDRLPVGTATASLVIAHGIWNLATSDDQFRAAVHESARIAQDDARLFLFTFSRATLPPGATPVAGERLIYTEFSGNKQVFLTENQIYTELQSAGFVPDPLLPLRELNRDNRPRLAGTGAPVIWEGVFRRVRTA